MSINKAAGRMPEDDTASSYEGPTVVGCCTECRHVAHIPDPDVMGEMGLCTGCNSYVRWSS